MATMSAISQNKPQLGSPDSNVLASEFINPAVADRPYIMGSAVVGTIPVSNVGATKVFVGQPETNNANALVGVMCLGAPQVAHRGNFVKDGFESGFNNFATGGRFWVALDLATFKKADLDGTNKNLILSVDKNGVFSYTKDLPTANVSAGGTDNNVEVSNIRVSVLKICDQAIIPAIDEVIGVGATNYTFKYTKGIGAILISL